MAGRRRRSTRQKNQKVKRQLLAGALVLAVFACISLFGGRGVIPTWEQLYAQAGVGNGAPAEVWQGGAEALPDTTEVQVHFVDVGQGDAVLIASEGQYALIDCGTEACEDALIAYLDQLGVTELQLLVMTHPHADHIGSMDAVLLHYRVKQLLLPVLENASDYPTSACFEHVLDAAEQTATPTAEAAVGQSWAVGGGTLSVLGTGVKTDNFNNISPCLKFTQGGFAFVDTGDGEKETEQALLDGGAALSATVFKAAHHGSSTSNTTAFLQAVSPQLVVVSCGQDNSYGHPHKEALAAFAAVDAEVLRTDENGSVVAVWNEETGLSVYVSCEAQENAAA